MASAFAVPLLSTVDPSHHVRGHSYPLFNRPQRSSQRLNTSRPVPLPRIPSERLDPRSQNFSDKIASNGRLREHEGYSNLSRTDRTSTKDGLISAPSDYPLKSSKRGGKMTSDSRPGTLSTIEAFALPSSNAGSCTETNAAKMPSRSLQDVGSPDTPGDRVEQPTTSGLVNNLYLSLFLTASTLILLGIYGRYKGEVTRRRDIKSESAGDKIKSSATRFSFPTVFRMGQRAVDIELPFFIALQSDSLITQLLLLIKISSGLLATSEQNFHLSRPNGWKRLFLEKGWSLGCLCLMIFDAVIHSFNTWLSFGTKTVVLLALVFSSKPPYVVEAAHDGSSILPPSSTKSTPTIPTKSYYEDQASFIAPHSRSFAPIVGSAEEMSFNFISGGLAAGAAGVLYLFYDVPHITIDSAATMAMVSFLATCSFSTVIDPASPVWLAAGLIVAAVGNTLIFTTLSTFWRDTISATLAFMAVQLDAAKAKPALELTSSSANGKNSTGRTRGVSAPTTFLLQSAERYPILRGILADKDSRRIFYFMLLNLCFMLVQSTYGVLTGSLGLISDSIHMFFDCFALFVGLCAAVMSKWPPSIKYPYGYGKLDTLSGFGNGIFLMLISIEIIWEAIERLATGSDLSRTKELLIVSILGLLVNLVGIMAFDHGHAHGHSHGGHSHGHHHGHGGDSHSHKAHSHSDLTTGQKSEHTKHQHGGDNMHGIYLHILADTMGSGAVVVSTLCVRYTGWSGFDPLASCAIAVLIFASAVPLVLSCGQKMLLSMPSDVEYSLRDILAGVSTIKGVAEYTVPKFWLDDGGNQSLTPKHEHNHDHHGHDQHQEHSCTHHDPHDEIHSHQSDQLHSHSNLHSHHQVPGDQHNHNDEIEKGDPMVLGVIHIIASQNADLEDVRTRVIDHLRSRNMDVLVQVERDGDFKCWCCGGKSW